MFYSYLKITLRNLLGNKLYSFINIFGLAVGLASVILLGLYVKFELSYDRQWADADQLYRVSLNINPGDGSPETRLATTPIPLAAWLKQDFPEIEEVARMRAGRVLLRRDDTAFYEEDVRDVDASFFRLFNLTWLQGDAVHALDTPDSIVLTRSKAVRYFGSEDALGKTLMLENSVPLKVTGVIADLPQNTHLTGDVFLAMEGYERFLPEDIRSGWVAKIMYTFVKLKPGVDISVLTGQLPQFINSHPGADAGQQNSLTVMRLADIHLHSRLDRELQAPGSFATVLTLVLVAVAILLIACFNFMNLATARSLLRSKEVGVRKIIGSDRLQLVWQFLGESIGMTLVATLLAVAIVEVLLPLFVGFTGKQIGFDSLQDHGLQGLLLILALVVGVLAGSWPAFYLSSLKPALVLRSSISASVGGILLRNLLVILQFAISIALVVATAVVLLQVRYAHDYDSGFNKEQVVVLDNLAVALLPTPRWSALKAELLGNADILSVTASDKTPGNVNLNSQEFIPAGMNSGTISGTTAGTAQSRTLISQFVDYGFFETYDIKLLAGHLFSPDFPADSMTAAHTNFIVNAAAARELGWTVESAVGMQLTAPFGPDVSLAGEVVGVVADSNFESVRSRIKPMVFMVLPDGVWDNIGAFGSASIRVSGRNTEATLAAIDAAWKKVIPEYPISRSFLSDNFAALYQSDNRLGQTYSVFSAVAILISCLGLYGLATFNTQRRIKEIGIRKVMGSSVWQIVYLLTGDFSRLVLLANLVAWPVAYFAMDRWLENFSYRIDLTPMIFIGSGLIALCIAWVTVGGTAAKAASQKPVLALRYE